MEKKPKIVIILGPTGVGKTALALDMASDFDGEIISADSMQVYRHLDIGTAKPTREEQERVPHHLIDIVDPDGDFNAAHFNRMAEGVIRDRSGKKAIFIVGGTGLYIRVLTGGLIEGPGPDEDLRKSYRDELQREDPSTLYERLRKLDSQAADRIHPRDTVRVIRALEIAELTGVPISEIQRQHGFREERYDYLKIGLYRDREELYRRIDSRAELMVAAGLAEETARIIGMGYSENLKPLQALGYRYFIQYIDGKTTLDEALRSMQRDTRHYARRQMTWFRGEEGIQWFHPDEERSVKKRIGSFLNRD